MNIGIEWPVFSLVHYLFEIAYAANTTAGRIVLLQWTMHIFIRYIFDKYQFESVPFILSPIVMTLMPFHSTDHFLFDWF